MKQLSAFIIACIGFFSVSSQAQLEIKSPAPTKLQLTAAQSYGKVLISDGGSVGQRRHELRSGLILKYMLTMKDMDSKVGDLKIAPIKGKSKTKDGRIIEYGKEEFKNIPINVQRMPGFYFDPNPTVQCDHPGRYRPAYYRINVWLPGGVSINFYTASTDDYEITTLTHGGLESDYSYRFDPPASW